MIKRIIGFIFIASFINMSLVGCSTVPKSISKSDEIVSEDINWENEFSDASNSVIDTGIQGLEEFIVELESLSKGKLDVENPKIYLESYIDYANTGKDVIDKYKHRIGKDNPNSTYLELADEISVCIDDIIDFYGKYIDIALGNVNDINIKDIQENSNKLKDNINSYYVQ